METQPSHDREFEERVKRSIDVLMKAGFSRLHSRRLTDPHHRFPGQLRSHLRLVHLTKKSPYNLVLRERLRASTLGAKQILVLNRPPDITDARIDEALSAIELIDLRNLTDPSSARLPSRTAGLTANLGRATA